MCRAVHAGGRLCRQPLPLSVERLIVSPMSTCYGSNLPLHPTAARIDPQAFRASSCLSPQDWLRHSLVTGVP